MGQMIAAELLIDKIKRDYADDISVLVIMGSTIYNDTHSRSDLDMFFVPKTERGFHLSFTCIIDGIGFDFWALPWERLECIANHEERIASMITEGRVLYCASDADQNRWNALKAKALNVSDRPRFLELSTNELDRACVDMVALANAQTLGEARFQAIRVIYGVGEALALLNGISIKRGRGKLKGEILAMPMVPTHFEELYDTAFYSMDKKEITASFLTLIQEIRAMIDAEWAKIGSQQSFSERWLQLYEELINSYNKIAHACECGDSVTPLFAAAELTKEIQSATRHTNVDLSCLPDLVGAYDPKNLKRIEEVAKAHKEALESLLEKQKVPVRRFADFTELEQFLAKL